MSICEPGYFDYSEDAIKSNHTKTIMAVVTNCQQLNLRKTPSKESEVLCILNFGEEVLIEPFPEELDDEDPNDEWAYVYAREGISGFAMGQYLKEA